MADKGLRLPWRCFERLDQFGLHAANIAACGRIKCYALNVIPRLTWNSNTPLILNLLNYLLFFIKNVIVSIRVFQLQEVYLHAN